MFEIGTEEYLKHGIQMTPGQDKDPRKDPLLTYADLKKKNLLGQKSNSKRKTSKRKKETQTEQYSYELYQRFVEEKILTEQDLVADTFRAAFPWVAKGAGALLAIGLLGAFYGLKVAKNKLLEKPRLYLRNSDEEIDRLFALQGIIAKFRSSNGWFGGMDKNDINAALSLVTNKIASTTHIKAGVAAYTYADAMVLGGAIQFYEKKIKELSEKEAQQQAQQGQEQEQAQQGQEQEQTQQGQQDQAAENPEKTLQQNSFTYDHYKKLIQEKSGEQMDLFGGGESETETSSTATSGGEQQNQNQDQNQEGQGKGVAGQQIVQIDIKKQEMASWLSKEWKNGKEFKKYTQQHNDEIKKLVTQFDKEIVKLKESIALLSSEDFLTENKPFESEFLNARLDLILEAKLRDSEIEELSKKQPKWVRDFLKATKKQFGANAFRKAAEENKLMDFVADRREKNPTNFDKWKEKYVKQNEEEGKRITEFLKKYRKENDEILSKINAKEEDEEESAEETPEENSSNAGENPDDVEIEEIEDESEVVANEDEEEDEEEKKRKEAEYIEKMKQLMTNKKKVLLNTKQELEKEATNFPSLFDSRAEKFLSSFTDMQLTNEKDQQKKTKAAIEALVKKSLTDTFIESTKEALKEYEVKVADNAIQKLIQGKNVLDLSDSFIDGLFDTLYKKTKPAVTPEQEEADKKRFYDCATGKECHLRPNKKGEDSAKTKEIKASLSEIEPKLKETKEKYKEAKEKYEKFKEEYDKKLSDSDGTDMKTLKERFTFFKSNATEAKNEYDALKKIKDGLDKALKAEGEKRKGILNSLFDSENVQNFKDNIKTDVINKVGGYFGINNLGSKINPPVAT